MSVDQFHVRRPLGVLLLSAASAAGANPTGPATLPSEEDLAPTVAPPSLTPWSWRATGLRRGFTPPAAPDAAVRGAFGPVQPWPSVPIHWVLTPDGRLLSFGATSDGRQGGQRDLSVWDPARGFTPEAFTLLPITTRVNNFCAGQWLMPDSGDVLITGGTQNTPLRYQGIAATTVFRSAGASLDRVADLQWRRWYPTALGTADGQVLVLGGRVDPATPGSPAVPALVPELYHPATGTWRVLEGAASAGAFGLNRSSWYYPRAWLGPQALPVIAGRNGSLYQLDPAGAGQLTRLAGGLPHQDPFLPALMTAPGRLLLVGAGRRVSLVDLNTRPPTVQDGAPISRHRRYGNATLLPDGQVLVNGGVDAPDNRLEGAHLEAELWNPADGQWRPAASAALPRLYHGNAILLPDATVLTGGGGLPGPLTNANVEVYYPPYLYRRDGSGLPAERPLIDTQAIARGWGEALELPWSGPRAIARLTLIGTGQATHAFNAGQRLVELPFSDDGAVLRTRLPATRGELPPGFYLLFALDRDGVPSNGKIVRVAP